MSSNQILVQRGAANSNKGQLARIFASNLVLGALTGFVLHVATRRAHGGRPRNIHFAIRS